MSLTGLTKRVPYETYAKIEAVNFSTLKEAGRSPRHYQHRLEHPRKASLPMTLGTAAHTAVLEPHRFLAEYALWDERSEESDKVRPRRGKTWDAFVASHSDKKILKVDEYSQAMAMRDSIRGHKASMRYLRTGFPEVQMLWHDAETETYCKGRLDWLTTIAGEDVLVGLKTARDCRHIAFGNASARLGYHLQWAFYRDGYEAITGRVAKVVELVVENFAPHDVVAYVIPDEVIEAGREEYRKLLLTLKECKASGDWPGSAEEEQILSLPSWVYNADDDITDLGLELTDG